MYTCIIPILFNYKSKTTRQQQTVGCLSGDSEWRTFGQDSFVVTIIMNGVWWAVVEQWWRWWVDIVLAHI